MSGVTVKKRLFGKLNRVPASETATYIFVAEDGTEIPAVKVAEETVFTATANDIRSGTVAATAEGVTEGTKVIPAYHTTEGAQLIPAGSSITITKLVNCDFTKLQALICAFASSMAASVKTDAVSINGKVYAVGSTDVLSEVAVDTENQKVNFGITNTGTTPCVIRYFTYKEIE